MYNYPIKKQSIYTKNFGNRGMSLENELNLSNQYYIANNIAIIHKKPTPVQIVKVDYPKRSAAVIKEAYFRTPSTTDYNGCYKGRYIDFEAKETANKTLFPMQNIHEHQVKHMKSIIDNKGITFMIIRFSAMNNTYLLKGEDLLLLWSEYQQQVRKSIRLNELNEIGYLVEEKYNPRIDYIKLIEEIYFSD